MNLFALPQKIKNLALLSTISVGVNLAGCTSEDITVAQSMSVVIDIQADVNNDGYIDEKDNEPAEINSTGAIVLPNLDDDEGRCDDFKRVANNGNVIADFEFISCSDASDNVSNGPDDIDDLTLVKLLPSVVVPSEGSIKAFIVDAQGKTIENSDFRILVREGDVFFDIADQPLLIEHLRKGVDLAIEATDVVRDTEEWDGKALLRVELKENEKVIYDDLPLQVAPIITQHETNKVTTLFVNPNLGAKTPDLELQEGTEEEKLKFHNLRPDRVAQKFLDDITNVSQDIVSDISLLDAANRSQGNLSFFYPWAQDLFEPAFVSRPNKDGTQVLRIALHTPHISKARPVADLSIHPKFKDSGKTSSEINIMLFQEVFSQAITVEEAGAIREEARRLTILHPRYTQGFLEEGIALYANMRGPNVGVVKIENKYLIGRHDEDKQSLETYNTTGNFTTTPPFVSKNSIYPQGRMIFGSSPNPGFIKLLTSQDLQDPINISTEWLLVGHVDEVISFLPSSINERGWIMAIADPDLALALLKEASEKTSENNTIFSGGYTRTSIQNDAGDFIDALNDESIMLGDVLSDESFINANNTASKKIADILDVLKDELALSEEDIVRVPALYHSANTNSTSDTEIKLRPFLPNAVNGVFLGSNTFVGPLQFGPVVDGVDYIQKAIEDSFAEHGISMRWVEDFNYAHFQEGNIHCVTNSFRNLDDVNRWWEKTDVF